MSDTISNPASGTEVDIPPGMRAVRGLLHLLQMAALALAIAPGLANLALRHIGVEEPLPEGWIRFVAVGDFLAMSIALLVLPGGARSSSRADSWSKVAEETGGDFRVEKRGLGSLGWTGGPTIQWDVQGVTVTLAQVSQSKGNASTRFTSQFPAAKELCLAVLPNNFLTRALTSPKFVGMVQAGARNAAGKASESVRAGAAREIGALAGARVTLGDPRLDEAIIVKGSDADLARYVLTGSGVPERMHEILAIRKSWTLSLFTAEGGQGAQLTLEFPGTESRPEALAAGRAFIETLLSSLRQNDVIPASVRGFGQDAYLHRAGR